MVRVGCLTTGLSCLSGGSCESEVVMKVRWGEIDRLTWVHHPLCLNNNIKHCCFLDNSDSLPQRSSDPKRSWC